MTFIKGRNIHDNILIAQEIAHSMYNSKGKNPYVMIKIDLEKAYEKLSWNAIISVLRACNFPKKLIDWISACLSTVSFACFINNQLSPFFISKRGI